MYAPLFFGTRVQSSSLKAVQTVKKAVKNDHFNRYDL